MLSVSLSQDVLARVMRVRRRRIGGIYGWQPPPADWRDIIRGTWPGFVRHSLTRVPDGWCDVILALADHLEGRGIDLFDAHEDPGTGKLSFTHAGRGSQQIDEDSSRVLDHYEALSASTCRVCGMPGEPVSKGTGKLATTKILCERHIHGDDDGRA